MSSNPPSQQKSPKASVPPQQQQKSPNSTPQPQQQQKKATHGPVQHMGPQMPPHFAPTSTTNAPNVHYMAAPTHMMAPPFYYAPNVYMMGAPTQQHKVPQQGGVADANVQNAQTRSHVNFATAGKTHSWTQKGYPPRTASAPPAPPESFGQQSSAPAPHYLPVSSLFPVTNMPKHFTPLQQPGAPSTAPTEIKKPKKVNIVIRDESGKDPFLDSDSDSEDRDTKPAPAKETVAPITTATSTAGSPAPSAQQGSTPSSASSTPVTVSKPKASNIVISEGPSTQKKPAEAAKSPAADEKVSNAPADTSAPASGGKYVPPALKNQQGTAPKSTSATTTPTPSNDKQGPRASQQSNKAPILLPPQPPKYAAVAAGNGPVGTSPTPVVVQQQAQQDGPRSTNDYRKSPAPVLQPPTRVQKSDSPPVVAAQKQAPPASAPPQQQVPSPQHHEGRRLTEEVPQSETDDDDDQGSVYSRRTSDEDDDTVSTGRGAKYDREALLKMRDRIFERGLNKNERPPLEAKEKMILLGIWQDKPSVSDNKIKREKAHGAKGTSSRKKVALTRGKDAWVPGAMNTNLDEQAKVRIEMTDILNKITPEKYGKLFRKFLDTPGVEKNENLHVMVECIQEKALLEPKFSDLYAKLCVDITKTKFFKGDSTEFKKCLLQAAQNEFDRERKIDLDDNPEYADKSPEEIEELKTKARLRALGNIRFIGEMYRVKLLSPKIIHHVVKDLLLKQTPTPEQIEVLCELLTSVGKLLDQGDGERFMDVYFMKLKELTNSPHLKTRIIFMIESVLELRADGWVPRIKEEKAKKLNQVLRDHNAEEEAKNRELREKRQAARSGKSKRSSKAATPVSSETGESGWQTTTTKRRPADLKVPGKSEGSPVVPATKGKFAVFQHTDTTPTTPITPAVSEPEEPEEVEDVEEIEEEELTDAQVASKIQFSINSFLEDPKEDAVGDIQQNLDLTERTFLVPQVIFDMCSNSKLDREQLSNFLREAINRKLVTPADVDTAFSQYYERVLKEQIFLDCALIFQNLAEVAPKFVNLERLCEIFTDGQNKYPTAGAPVDQIAFFICEALRQQADGDVEVTLKRYPRFVALHMIDTTKMIKIKGKLLKNEGIKTLMADLHDVWALDHVLSGVDFNRPAESWNARRIACGVVCGVELKNKVSTLDNYKAYLNLLQNVAAVSPKFLVEEAQLICSRYPEKDRFQRVKGFFVELGLVSQAVADSVQ